MEEQVKNKKEQFQQEIPNLKEYNQSDLDLLKQMGEIAREFQSQYHALKEEDLNNNYQRHI